MKKTVSWCCAALLAAMVGCSGPRAASRPADAQSGYEPKSAPGEGQKFLSRMVGRWSVVRTFYPRSGGEPTVTRGECTQSLIHDGRFLQSDFVFHDTGGDSTGTGIIGYDPETRKFTSFWVDSRSTRASVRQSEEEFDGQRIVLFSKSLGETAGASARRSRTISVLENGDRRLLHKQWSDSPDAPARQVMQLDMTRVD